ncbi:MAG: hypothetical protein ABJZ55_25955 [Fuerstiella sp.]
MFRSVIQKLDLSNSVRWALATRVWQIMAGAISMYLLYRCLSSVERGYYMTLWSFVAMQILVDLGFSIAVVNFSSHEWTHLKLNDQGAIEGPEHPYARLIGLGQFTARWFAVGSVGFLFIAGLPSDYLFSQKNDPSIAWKIPLWSVMVASAISLFCSPFLAMLEGCGQLPRVYRFRFYQAVLTNMVVWGTLLLGGGLYAAVAAAGVRAACEVAFLLGPYRSFFRPLWSERVSGFQWKKEFWPVQWRLAIGGGLSYFAYNLFNPVMFHYHSEKLAGQMGMTRQLLITIQSAAQTWLNVRVPQFGQLIAKRHFLTLDRLFFKALLVSSIVLLLGGGMFVLGVMALEYSESRYSGVLLPVAPTVLFLVGFLVFQVPFAQTVYLRAHCKEPVFVATVISNLLIALAVWWFGKEYGASGAAMGYLIVVITVTTPLIHRVFLASRSAWHDAPADDKIGRGQTDL